MSESRLERIEGAPVPEKLVLDLIQAVGADPETAVLIRSDATAGTVTVEEWHYTGNGTDFDLLIRRIVSKIAWSTDHE